MRQPDVKGSSYAIARKNVVPGPAQLWNGREIEHEGWAMRDDEFELPRPGRREQAMPGGERCRRSGGCGELTGEKREGRRLPFRIEMRERWMGTSKTPVAPREQKRHGVGDHGTREIEWMGECRRRDSSMTDGVLACASLRRWQAIPALRGFTSYWVANLRMSR